VTGGGLYCDVLADWSVRTTLTYFDASEQTFLVAQLTNKQYALRLTDGFIPTHGDHSIASGSVRRPVAARPGLERIVPTSINMANSPQCT
jgi:hypothetical protein